MKRTRSALAGLAVLAAIALLPALARGTSSDQRVYFPASCSMHPFKYKPRTVCFGNGLWIRHITWESYGGRRAVARGEQMANTCKPTCAEGTVYWVKARFSVFRVRWACGRRIYTRMSLRGEPLRLWVPGFDRCQPR